jgi:4-hydroxy-3-polyprenylbenzoate decarboxylase
MPAQDLRSFIARLEAAGRLRRVRAQVSTHLEIAEIASRLVAEGGPAALFENVRIERPAGTVPSPRGPAMPVLVGAFAGMQRMAWALGGESLDALAARLADLIRPPEPGGGLFEKLKAAPRLLALAAAAAKTVRSGPCQEVVRTGAEADLSALPVIQCWPGDGGPYITLPQVYTTDPDGKHRNVGMYRMQVYGPQACGMHWHRDHDGARNYRAWAALGREMPVAVALGGDPVLTYAATAPLPYGMDELMLAGILRGESVRLVRARTVPLDVPADAEIVIEGFVDPEETVLEGPFGDHTGYYSLADRYPVMRVTAVTHRHDAIYPTTVVGRYPKEDCYLAKATERLFLPAIRTIVPEIVDLNLPLFGVFHNWALVSIRKTHPWQAHKVMHALWGLGQMMYTKFLVVVDESVNVQDAEEVLWRVGAEADPRRDVVIATGPADVLDHAAPASGPAGKMGIDATRKLPEEGAARWPDPIASDPEVRAGVARRWAELGLG